VDVGIGQRERGGGREDVPISSALGHATVSITLDTYSHAIPAMQEEAAALIAGLVFTGK
jgi:integrase